MVRRMWDMMLTGNFTPRQILKVANGDWGLRTVQYKQLGGVPLSIGGIYRLFGNIFYTGLFEWSGKIYHGKHKPIISVDEFDRVQILLGRKGKPRPQHHDFAYTGLIDCAECGMRYTATAKVKMVKSSGEIKSYTYYHCTRKRKDIICCNKPVTVTELEESIDTEFEKHTIIETFLDWAIDYLESEKSNLKEESSKRTKMLNTSLGEAQKSLDNLIQMRYRDLIDDSVFLKEQCHLKDKIIKLEARIKHQNLDPNQEIDLTIQAFRYAAYARAHLIKGSIESKREIVSSFGSNYQMANKKLLFTKAVWLNPIEESYPELIGKYRRLELKKDLDEERKKQEINKLIHQWCPGWESNPHGFATTKF